MGDISKLPKWAQNEISRLRRQVNDLKSENARISVGDTNTAIGSYRDEFVHVDDHTIVRFYHPDDRRDYIEVGWRDVGGAMRVEARAGANRRMRLSIEPQATNVVVLSQGDF